jgi:hypothetical protein
MKNLPGASNIAKKLLFLSGKLPQEVKKKKFFMKNLPAPAIHS